MKMSITCGSSGVVTLEDVSSEESPSTEMEAQLTKIRIVVILYILKAVAIIVDSKQINEAFSRMFFLIYDNYTQAPGPSSLELFPLQ